jgi:hypothetical protein
VHKILQYIDNLFRELVNRITRFLQDYFWFVLLALILLLFFFVNFGHGRFYAFTDISNIELHPWQEFLKRFSMWQQTRGFGVEMGTEAGYAVPLLFFSFLSAIGFSALQINFTINLLLFILPGLSISILAYSIFYRERRRNLIAFFSGLLAATSFVMYIRGLSPLFLEVWPWIISALITSAILLLLQTGKKRLWLVLIILFYLNLGSFSGLGFAVVPFAFGVLYLLYYLLAESQNKKQDLKKVLLVLALFMLISLPLVFAVANSVFSLSFQAAASAKTYTWSVFTLNLDNRDFSSLFYGFRLIGTCNWNAIIAIPNFAGRLCYPYYTLFTNNPVFILSSFLLPVAAFASMMFKDSNKLRFRLIFLGMVSILFLFMMKGVREPFGELFLWLMTHVSLFSIFRTPYDKIAPALAYSLCISAAYTFAQILTYRQEFSLSKLSLSKTFFKSFSASGFIRLLRKKSTVKKMIAFAFLFALIIDSYPAFSGQLLYAPGFFNIPSYYQQLADYVKSDPVSYKIMGIPSIEYTNRYSWGYFGITFDGVNLDKPMLEPSYTGSDLFDDRIISALHNEVLFRSDLPVAPVAGSPIFADNTTPNETVNVDRVKYFGYLLQKSNVGQIILRHDMAGGYAYQLNDTDWQRYNDLFASLNGLGFTSGARTFGNVTIFNTNNFMPLIYSNSPTNVYSTNDYDSILGSAYVNSRVALFASLNNYNISYDYVTGNNGLGFHNIYAPIIADQYRSQVQNDLIQELQYTATPNVLRIAQLNGTVMKLDNIISSNFSSVYYVDYIQNPGLFDIFLKLGNNTLQNNKSVLFDDQRVPISDIIPVGNGWFNVGTVHLNAGDIVLHTDIPQEFNLTFAKGITEDKLPSRIVVQNIPISRMTNGSWIVDLSFEIKTDNNLAQLLSDKSLDANFRHNIADALNVTFTVSNLDVALVSEEIQNSNSNAQPHLIFNQIQPGKLLVNVENASSSFFLNFLESYNSDWKLYLVPPKTLNDNSSVRDFAGSDELRQEGALLPDSYDLAGLQSTPVFDKNHLLLDGFANSWYVDLKDIANQSQVMQETNGMYSFTLLLYFKPQANFVLGLGISIVASVLVCVLLSYSVVRVWSRSRGTKRKKGFNFFS